MLNITDYTNLLTEFVALKSISTDSAFRNDCHSCANWLLNLFSKNGFETKLIESDKTNPVVYASYVADVNAKTILIYGHYDVQPAGVHDGWSTDDPFKLEEKTFADNSLRLVARGSIDNKGQVLVHVFSVIELIKQKKLKYNVKFLIEGNEETGNVEIFKQVKESADLLKCDLVIVSDGERPAVSNDLPVLEVSLRGGANSTLKLKTSRTNLHSGIYGKAVPTAIEEMYLLLSKLYKDDQTINIEGYYNELPVPTEAQLQNNKLLEEGKQKEILDAAGVKSFKKESAYDFYTQTGLRPSIIVTGIKGGYIGEGYANIVPCECEARINFRVVAPQNPKKCLELFEKFIKENLPNYVDFEFRPNDPYRGYFSDPESEDFKTVEQTLKEIFNSNKVVHRFVGGGIPIVTCFKEILGKDTIMLPLASHDCNMHGVDENFDLELLKQALNFSEKFFG